MKSITLSPAYGRDYRNAHDARCAFDMGRDFVTHTYPGDPNCGGTYTTKAELGKLGYTHATIRYNKMTQVTHVVTEPLSKNAA